MDYDTPQNTISFDNSEKTSSEVFSYSGNSNNRTFVIKIILGSLLLMVIIFSILFIMLLPPRKVISQNITVSEGLSVKQVGNLLQEKNIIKNSSLFALCSRIVAKKESVRTGNYAFEKPEHVCRVAYRMSRGIYGTTQIKITIPEGVTNNEIGEIIISKYPEFNEKQFLELAKPLQGKLFPDTYFFFRGFTPQQFINELQEVYAEKTKDIFTGVSPERQKQVLIMASILEREANNPEEAKIVSGILWKRIQIGMPLQVDATLRYTTGRGSSELTLDDLQRDGPYNTYTRTGLPPSPIGNPGLAMITAAMNPEKSPYLYYLHDNNGNIYYAKTHDEHVNNKNKYLK